MRYDGDFEGVVRSILLRERYIQNGNPRQEDITAALFKSVGLRRGVIGAGMGRALERRKLTRVIRYMIGSSTGAASGLFMPGEDIGNNIDIYWNEASSREFLSFLRGLYSFGSVQNARSLCSVFRRRMNLGAFYASPVEFRSAVTCARTGKGAFLNGKRPGVHPVDVVLPSISIPGISGDAVEFDGGLWLDGAGAMSMPTREIIEEFKPTDLLIFANCPSKMGNSRLWNIGMHLCTMGYPAPVRDAFLSSADTFADGVRYLKSQNHTRWAILYTDESIGIFERDPQKLQRAAAAGEAFVEECVVRVLRKGL